MQIKLKLWYSDFCALLFAVSVTPVQHLLAWFTPERRQLINSSAVDRHAKRPKGTFSRFLKQEKNVTLGRVGLKAYYPVLQVIGYLPPTEFWIPSQHLTGAENSSEVREWFTSMRRELLNLRQLDKLSERAFGVLGRYLNNEPNLTFKIIGIQVYYPMLQLFGFVPPSSASNLKTAQASHHLLTWLTPERRRLINALGLDEAAQQPQGTLAGFLSGQKRLALEHHSIEAYYAAFRLLGYHPELDLSVDESVRRVQQPDK